MNAPPDWYRTFFTGAFVDFWLRVPTAEQNRQEADFIEQALQVSAPGKLLDVPCGGGRHCLELAARGYEMTGVDISPEFLKAGRAQTPDALKSIAWEERDMRDLPWPQAFDGAYCLGNSFSYLEDDQAHVDFLSAVARSLKPGARFVLDTSYVLEVLLPTLQERAWYEMGDILFLGYRRYDPLTSQLHVEYTIVRDGTVEKRAMIARIYSVQEILRLFQRAGFADVQAYGSLTRDPFKLGSHRLLAVATKGASASSG
ncbi:MAG TPA: methyltransferase domain-containing protein [Isosphaeraceae bacterium]|jgi:SAM-dependent methyltransferase|nr:methyltransferase domain-containing protein [Isosphaeraceae bacterium]